MFSESSFMLVYISRVSMVTIAQSYQILARALNSFPPVLWCPKKHGINRINDHLLSQLKIQPDLVWRVLWWQKATQSIQKSNIRLLLLLYT